MFRHNQLRLDVTEWNLCNSENDLHVHICVARMLLENNYTAVCSAWTVTPPSRHLWCNCPGGITHCLSVIRP